MTYTVESKSILAKLLASENITVRHVKASTASFDLSTRTLFCPIWVNMDGHMYDLLMGHEVGHALETPPEGWHNALIKNKKFKHFLNVIEDARIEKKMKRRYPGLRSSFIRAYNELNNRNFFEIKDKNINDLFLIDKINIYFKLGANMNISFNKKELVFVKRTENAETWNDVLSIATDLWKYSKVEQRKVKTNNFNQDLNSSDDEFPGSSVSSDDDSEDFDDFDDKTYRDDDFDDKTYRDDDSDDLDDKTYRDDDSDDKTYRSDGFSDHEDDDFNFQPTSYTDQAFRKNENKLLDESSKNFTYFNIPEAKIENAIFNIKEVFAEYDLFYKDFPQQHKDQFLKDFKRKNEKYINLLAKEFEMKKAATLYNKSLVSDSGDIDVNKIYRYQIEDNIFRKMTMIPKGKSHGFVMIVDKSGSMSEIISKTIEQTLIIAMFCRKVGIPFVAYSFTNHQKINHKSIFSKNRNDISLNEKFSLREMISSQLKASDFRKALVYQLLIANSHEQTSKRNYKIPFIGLPHNETLGGTPLNEALICSKKIIENFKQKNKLNNVSLIVLHDGDSDTQQSYWNDIGSRESMFTSFRHRNNFFVFVDKKNNFEICYDYNEFFDHRSITKAIMKNIQTSLNVNVIGFYIKDSSDKKSFSRLKYYRDKNDNGMPHRKSVQFLNLHQQFKEKKFIESFIGGYDTLFIINGDNSSLKYEDETLEIKGNVTVKKLTNEFIKVNKKRQVNRLLVSKFIDLVST